MIFLNFICSNNCTINCNDMANHSGIHYAQSFQSPFVSTMPQISPHNNVISPVYGSSGPQIGAYVPGNPQVWSQNVPHTMPWSNEAINPQNITGNFAFTCSTMLNGTNNHMSTPIPHNHSVTISDSSQSIFYDQTLPNYNNSIQPIDSVSLQHENVNKNNKRCTNPMDDNGEIDIDFDFECRRPIKKYISEDKVFEIFDRLQIRDGNNYIVEDEPDEKCQVELNKHKHNVTIEMIEDNDHVIQFSTELKNAFQNNNNNSITNKLIENEKDKLSKAVILWQPNTILKSFLDNPESDDDTNENDKNSIKIEEVLSDDDEEMYNLESNLLIEQVPDEESFDSMNE